MTSFIKVEEENIKELAELAKDIWFEYWQNTLTLGQIYYMVNKFQSEIALTEQIQRENFTYYFIENNDEIVGYFGIVPEEKQLFLSKLYLTKENRAKGIGKAAFEKIKEIAKEKNLTRIQLTVNKQNFKTIQIYEKWGFKSLHAMTTRIGNGYVMDDYLMEYDL